MEASLKLPPPFHIIRVKNSEFKNTQQYAKKFWSKNAPVVLGLTPLTHLNGYESTLKIIFIVNQKKINQLPFEKFCPFEAINTYTT